MSIQKIATWIPVTTEALEDAPYIRLGLEYEWSGKRKPLTAQELVTGWRSFTSSDGLTGEFRIGWRLDLWHFFRKERCAIEGHPLGEWETDDGWGHRECVCGARHETARPEYPA